MDFSNQLFRASSNGHLMTEPKTKAAKDAGELSEGTKTHLIDIYVSNKYGRNTDIQNKYVSKGLMVEEDSITLYSRYTKKYFKKNESHLSNDFIKGTPDLFTGLEITAADTIIDVKSSWDIFTFFRTKAKGFNPMYYWQLQSYMALTGAGSATLAYCLIDTPELLINDEKRKLMYKMGAATTETPDYIKACEELDTLMIYKDIPLKEKVIEYHVERNEDDIQKLYARIIICRQFLNEMECPTIGTDLIEETAQSSKKAAPVFDINNISLSKI